ncbi:hypothetical protein pEaSNUABM54_00243 [Erwinia phage pEa_SNUABM_54]|nr:hypothetical protein pEaSNUABM54_00243 [Erwinia phage pEa_SNUABM_54]
MGLDITLVKGTVHPNYLARMEQGETIGAGLKFDGGDIITVTEDVYYQRRMFMVRDVLKAALGNASESEYHLLTPERMTKIIDLAREKSNYLEARPSDVYHDEVQPLCDLILAIDTAQRDESDELYFAIWG